MSAVGHQEVTFQKLAIDALTRAPHDVAVVDGSRVWTREQLARRVGAVADEYRRRGLGPGSRIALLCPNSADYLAAMLAAVMTGCTYTGLHPLGSFDDHKNALETLGADLLVAHPGRFGERASMLEDSGAAGMVVDLGAGGDHFDLTTCGEAPLRVDRVEATSEGSISFTGGTTGRSKGVLRSQRALAWSAVLMTSQWDWPRNLRFLATAPLTHATGAMVVPILLRGGQVHIHDGFDVDRVLGAITAKEVNSTFVVPTMMYRLLDTATDAMDLSSMEHLIYGAASSNPSRLDQALERLGPVLMQLYGQVEAPNTIAAMSTTDHRAGDLQRLSACGRPLMGIDVALMDSAMNQVPMGEPGEICVRGPLVMEGYLDAPEATDEALRGGWLHTGDIATADADGFLTIVDRAKDMIVTGGFNVYPREIEDVIARHDAVSGVAVVGLTDDDWGEAVNAFVVVHDGVAVDPVTLATELKAMVREHKGPVHTPKAVHMIDALPTTSLGKPDKQALRDRFG